MLWRSQCLCAPHCYIRQSKSRPPPLLISSRQCLRITASTCLLFVIICYLYYSRGRIMMPPRVRLFTPAALIRVVTVYAVLSEHTFIGICFIYHYECGFMSASPRRQNVAWTLVAEIACDCNRPPPLQVNCYLLSSILHDTTSPFLRGRWAGRECRTALYSSRGLDL